MHNPQKTMCSKLTEPCIQFDKQARSKDINTSTVQTVCTQKIIESSIEVPARLVHYGFLSSQIFQ